MEDMTGKRVPEVTFKTREGGQWKDLTSKEVFEGKKVVVFSLPGAFTPTCSTSHVPRYNELTELFEAQGVDSVVCVSVNDAFVMNEWQFEQDAWNLLFLPDGNGEFTEKMGALVDKSDIGFGKRSWRYSMVVDDGMIEKMFIEEEVPGDPYDVSDADTMLKYLAPDAELPPLVTIFTKKDCPYCLRAKAMLEEKGWEYEELLKGVNVSSQALRSVTGKNTYPQVYINGELIGGSDDLAKYLGIE